MNTNGELEVISKGILMMIGENNCFNNVLTGLIEMLKMSVPSTTLFPYQGMQRDKFEIAISNIYTAACKLES